MSGRERDDWRANYERWSSQLNHTPQWDRPPAQTYSDEPFVIRWTSSMAETEDRAVFCVGCGRRWEAVYRDGRVVDRTFLPDDGKEQARAVAAQRAKVERP